MIMTIAIIYICLILYDIWLTVENYFQPPPLPPEKTPPPLFPPPPPPLKIQKVQVTPFWPTLKTFQALSAETGEHCNYYGLMHKRSGG